MGCCFDSVDSVDANNLCVEKLNAGFDKFVCFDFPHPLDTGWLVSRGLGFLGVRNRFGKEVVQDDLASGMM